MFGMFTKGNLLTSAPDKVDKTNTMIAQAKGFQNAFKIRIKTHLFKSQNNNKNLNYFAFKVNNC